MSALLAKISLANSNAEPGYNISSMLLRDIILYCFVLLAFFM